MRNQTRLRFYVEFVYNGVIDDHSMSLAVRDAVYSMTLVHDVRLVRLDSNVEVLPQSRADALELEERRKDV